MKNPTWSFQEILTSHQMWLVSFEWQAQNFSNYIIFLFHSFALHGLAHSAYFSQQLGQVSISPSFPLFDCWNRKGEASLRSLSNACRNGRLKAETVNFTQKEHWAYRRSWGQPSQAEKGYSRWTADSTGHAVKYSQEQRKYKKQFYFRDNLLKKQDGACQHGEVDAELLKWFTGLRYVLPEYAHAQSLLPPLPFSLWALRPKLTCACQKIERPLGAMCTVIHAFTVVSVFDSSPSGWHCHLTVSGCK